MANNEPARKNDRAPLAKGEAGPETTGDPVRSPSTARRPYERFLGLPTAVVLAALWVVGLMILGSLALVVYSIWWVLARLVAGII